MKRIAVLSDTHGYFDPSIPEFTGECDEVWHAGDWGREVAEKFQSAKKLRGVSGNIDGNTIRQVFPEELFFNCEGVKVFLIHIGGYPPRYEPGIKEKLQTLQPDILVCGHSHILKIMRDAGMNNLLCINPGAAGKVGFHQVRTMVRLKIEGTRIFDVEVIELGKRA